jgi:geranylgeranyl reductase family protein
MDREHDVIVVGAGPAGAMTATILAQQNYDVLLLDRNGFPRDKVCGDGIPAGAFERLYRLGMQEKFEEALLRGEMYEIHKMSLVFPKGRSIVADFNYAENATHSYVMPRLYFDAVIQEHAVDSGAQFQVAAVKEPLIDNGRIVGVNAQVNGSVKPIRSKVVVGADGVTSVIARNLRPKQEQHKDKHRAIALRAYINDIEIHPGEVEFFLYEKILPGYAWIFPMGEEEANIGLGMRLDIFRKIHGDLKTMLRSFLDLPMIKKRLKRGGELEEIRSWQLSFGSQGHVQHAFNGALLVGDAGGFINPITGGGIHNALISSELAAQTINEAFNAGDTSLSQLKIYEKRTHDAMWKSMQRSYLMQRLMIRFPGLVEFLIGRAQTNKGLVQIFLDKL